MLVCALLRLIRCYFEFVAYTQYNQLRSVTIGDSVASIGSYAFFASHDPRTDLTHAHFPEKRTVQLQIARAS